MQHPKRRHSVATAENVKQVSVQGTGADFSIFVINYNAFFQFQARVVRKLHDFTLSKYVAVGADPGVAYIPIGYHVTIRFATHKKVIEHACRRGNEAVRTHVVTMGYIQEEPAFFGKQASDGI